MDGCGRHGGTAADVRLGCRCRSGSHPACGFRWSSRSLSLPRKRLSSSPANARPRSLLQPYCIRLFSACNSLQQSIVSSREISLLLFDTLPPLLTFDVRPVFLKYRRSARYLQDRSLGWSEDARAIQRPNGISRCVLLRPFHVMRHRSCLSYYTEITRTTRPIAMRANKLHMGHNFGNTFSVLHFFQHHLRYYLVLVLLAKSLSTH